MVDYKTLKAEEIKYGTNNFIEIARKEVDGNEFISLSKGYFTPDGQRRYKTGLGFPDEGGIANFLVDAIAKMSKDKTEPQSEVTLEQKDEPEEEDPEEDAEEQEETEEKD